jgi:hypothetical protein
VECDDGVVVIGGLLDDEVVGRLLPLEDRHRLVLLRPLPAGEPESGEKIQRRDPQSSAISKAAGGRSGRGDLRIGGGGLVLRGRGRHARGLAGGWARSRRLRVIVAVQHTEEERRFVWCGAVVWWMSGRCGGVVDEWMSLLCGAVACCAVGCVVRRVRRVR